MSALLARPLFDTASKHSHAWAEEVLSATEAASVTITDLSEGDATKSKLQEKIEEENPVAFLFYDHGSRRRFIGQDMGALVDYVSSRLMKGRLVYSMCCLSGSALGPRIIGAGGLAFFGYKEEFGFFVGSAEPAFRESANSGWFKLLEEGSIGEALNAMLEKFNEWLDYYTEGPGSEDPNAPLIGSWLVHDRDCLVVLGDMDLKLGEIPIPPEPGPASLWDRFVGFIWAILDAFGL